MTPPETTRKTLKSIAARLTLTAAALLIGWPATAGAVMNITPRLKTGVEYTDNFFLARDQPGSRKESVWTTTVSPGLTVDMAGRTADLSLSYDPTYFMYDKYSKYDYWQHAANLTGNWQPTRHLSLKLTDDYLRSENPIAQGDLTVRRSRQPYTSNTTQAHISQQFGPEDSIYADGIYSFLNNNDPAIPDSKRYGGDGGVKYWFNIHWGLDAGAGYYQGRYDSGLDDYHEWVGHTQLNRRFNPHFTGFLRYEHTIYRFDNSDTGDFQVYDGSVGFDSALGPTMDLTMSAHYLYRDVKNASNDSAWPLSIDFTKRFQHGSVSLNGEGGYSYTTTTAQNLGAYSYYNAGVKGSYDFTRRLSGDVNALYSYRDYKNTSPRRKDDVVRAGCGLSFQLLRWLSARLGYTHNSVNSTIDSESYEENVGSLMFTVAPAEPYRL